LAIRPGTNEVCWGLWAGTPGTRSTGSPTAGGGGELRLDLLRRNGNQFGYDNANLTICENPYALPGGIVPPYYTYNHSAQVVAGESCPTGSSSIAELASPIGAGP
jgi:hypothetical protein